MELENKLSNRLCDKLHESLLELIGFHRQLLEVVKAENFAIENADIKATYESTASKETLIHLIHQSDMGRQTIVHAIVMQDGIEIKNPSLKELIIHFQTQDVEVSNKLQADLNMLLVLVDRIKKQNELNGKLVAESLRHINNMKKNIFGETTHKARTYNQQGQKNQGSTVEHGPRLISREA